MKPPFRHQVALPQRKPLRLQGYTYDQNGAYFVTVCTQNRLCLLGDVVQGEMVLNDAGRMVEAVWQALPTHYPNIGLDAFVIMPNHVHAVVFIENHPENNPNFVGDGLRAVPPSSIISNGTAQRPSPTVLSLIGVMHRFKSYTTTQYRCDVKQHNCPPFNGKLWQRGYYDHIIRNEADLDRIRLYIANNPAQWATDENNPNFVGDGLRAVPKNVGDGLRAVPPVKETTA